MFKETELGFEFKNSCLVVFFGKKEADLEKIKNQYSVFSFSNIKQTHSDICVAANLNNHSIEADAHYSNQIKHALLVRTADCLPIMVYSPERKCVLAVHAGWRGIENQITLKSLKKLGWKDQLEVYIGPHILKASFEVEADVKEKLLKNAPYDKSSYCDQKENKYFIDLQKIILDQLKQEKYQIILQNLNLNTYQNLKFNSYRTDQSPNRNISFIALL